MGLSRPIQNVNDLATIAPDICKEWNYEKNSFSPNDVTAHSKRKVWWVCSKCSYEWEATISNRVDHGTKCPACSNFTTIVVKGKNDLATTNPDLVKEWDYDRNLISPYEVSKGSHKKVWWRIEVINPDTHRKRVLRWEAVIKDRVKGNGCPYITNGKVLLGFNDLYTKYPDIAAQWDYKKNSGISPKNFPAGSHKVVWWKCDVCSTEWKSTIKDRVNGTGCPMCTKYTRTSFPEQAIFFYIKKYYRSAINTYKDIFDNGMELDIYIPTIKTGVEYDGIFWHESRKSTKRAEMKYDTCKKNNIRLIRINEDTLNNSKDYCDELLFCDFSHKEFYKIDETVSLLLELLGYSGKVNINTRRDEIAIKEKYYASVKQSSFKELYPTLATQWHPKKNGKLTPEMFGPHSNHKAWWYCRTCKGEWNASIDSRTNGYNKGQGNCPICTSHMLKKGFNDLETWCKKNNSSLLSLWDFNRNSKNPCDYLPNSMNKAQWKCDVCGEEWTASISAATKWVGCPKCFLKNRVKHVLQYDYNGNLIDRYSSVSEAAIKLNLSKQSLYKACSKGKQYFGFLWKYE